MKNALLKTLVLGSIQTNVYILSNKETGEAILVDPADQAPRILEQLRNDKLSLKAILLTHGHLDHILAVRAVAEACQVPVYAFEAEKALLESDDLNRSRLYGVPCRVTPDILLKDLQLLELAGFRIQVLHTPGHTAGSCCYYIEAEQLLFSGDTLFAGSYGRYDLPTGNGREIITSVRKLLTSLPRETRVYPGHMGPTTIDYEQLYNPLA